MRASNPDSVHLSLLRLSGFVVRLWNKALLCCVRCKCTGRAENRLWVKLGFTSERVHYHLTSATWATVSVISGNMCGRYSPPVDALCPHQCLTLKWVRVCCKGLSCLLVKVSYSFTCDSFGVILPPSSGCRLIRVYISGAIWTVVKKLN